MEIKSRVNILHPNIILIRYLTYEPLTYLSENTFNLSRQQLISEQTVQTAGVSRNEEPFVYRQQTSPRNPKI